MSPERRLRLKADVRRVGGQVVGQQTPPERPALISGAPREVRQRWKQNALVVGDSRSFKSYDGSSFVFVDLDASKRLRNRNPLLWALVHVASLSHALVLSYGPASGNVPRWEFVAGESFSATSPSRVATCGRERDRVRRT